MADRAYRSLSAQQHEAGSRDKESTISPPAGSDFHRSPAPRSPLMHARQIPSPPTSHRHSFSEQFLGMQSSRRNSRHLSISSQGLQELFNNPPKAGAADPAFAGRDWHTIAVGELVDPEDVRFVEVDTGIEEATNLLIESGAGVLLVRANADESAAVATFDYKDLNQYLLFATGSLRPDSEHLGFFQELAKKAQAGHKIPIRDAKSLGAKEPFVTVPHTVKLTKVIEAFGSGVHRLVVVREWTNEVIGILSQFRLVKFLWENGRSFPIIDELYPQALRDIGVGSQDHVISINGDRPLREALIMMDLEAISSLAVVDNQHNVVGNISTVDVKLLTKSSSAPLLDNTCIHFISVILSARGVDDGQDSFPVFYVSPYSTLAHTVAKLVATRSHRMWVVESPSPSDSAPTTPILPPSGPVSANTVPPRSSSPSAFSQFPLSAMSPAISAAALPGAHMSGRLSGVVSLTDILNLFARASGLNPSDPNETRRHRRRSSSSSVGLSLRASMDEKRDGGTR